MRHSFWWVASVALTSASCSAAGAAPPMVTPAHPDLSYEESVDFQVYRSDGTTASLADVVADMAQVDVALLGEEHDDAVGHGVQLQVFESALGRYGTGANARPIVLSLEMFERDVQYVVDEYLAGLITEDHFLASSRPWDTYSVFYRPVVELARERGLPVVAANAPRRYVNRASRLGRASLADLPPAALATLPPLPYPEPSEAYLAEWNGLMGEAAGHMSGSPLDGQTLWDAGMAFSISEALSDTPNGLVVHLAGGFHVENGTGIAEVLQRYRMGSRTLIVAVRKASDINAFDPASHEGLGDYVILTQGG